MDKDGNQEHVSIPLEESDIDISKQTDGTMIGKLDLGHDSQRAKFACYVFSILRAFSYPLFKISLIALSNQVVKETVHASVEPELFNQIYEAIYGSITKDSVTSIYLMDSLDFYQTFIVTSFLITIYSISTTIHCALREQYLNRIEVKRLQQVFYQRFMSGSNTIDTKAARDAVYTQISTIEKYWTAARFQLVDTGTTVLFCLILLFILAWDLSLVSFVSMVIIGVVGNMIWAKMSKPWSYQREMKVSETNARLIDLVLCKDVVVNHSMEDAEGKVLHDAIGSDKREIYELVKAKITSDLVQNLTFTMVVPFLFLYVYKVEPTFERVFQLLIVMVIMDEVCRTYLKFLNCQPIIQEGQRAQKIFADAVQIDEEELFPRDFGWPTWVCCKKSKGGSPKVSNNTMDLIQTSTKHTDGYSTQHSIQSTFETIQSKLSKPGNEDMLAFKGVSLGYHRKDGSVHKVIRDFNLSFCLGQQYALMGESGAGKSTLLKALEGLMPLLTGQISVCGTAVDTSSSDWRKQLAVISQDSVLFNRTLRENLVYGQSNVSDEAVWDALDKVNLRDVVTKLPEGLDTMIYRNGNEFSGGQKQRFQIARVFLNSFPKIVLMDEMTSALDIATKKSIMNELKSYLVGKTVIMITHDIDTLELVEHIIDLSSQSDSKKSTRRSSSVELCIEMSEQLQRVVEANEHRKSSNLLRVEESIVGLEE